MDSIIYDTLKETLVDLKKNNSADKSNDLCKVYVPKIKEVNEKYDLLNIDMIKEDQELYDFLKELLA